MPVGYLVSVLFLAAVTLFAVRPMRGSPALATLSFWLGLVVNELPFLAAAWLVLATGLAFAQGDVRGPGGWVVVGLAALTSVGLAVIVWRGTRAGPALERALDDGLGPGWRGSLDARRAAGLRRRLPLVRILLRPVVRGRPGVRRVADLRYGEAGDRNLLDVYLRRSRPSGAPVLIHLHGGRFVRGRKNSQSLPLLYRLASQGWVCVSANYRLSPAARFPDHLVDVKKVIGWVREHGAEYGADTSAVFVSGSSAGGYLASMAALTPNDPRFQPGFEQVDTSVAAAVSLNGYHGPVEDRGAAMPSSPLAHVRPDAPPFLIVHGDLDTVVPVESARRFAARLRSVSSRPVVYAELPGGQHAFDLFHSLRFEAVVTAVESFGAWVLSGGGAHRGTPGQGRSPGQE